MKIKDELWELYQDYVASQLEAELKPSKYKTWLKHELQRRDEEKINEVTNND